MPEKPHSYYEQARPELVALLPDRLGRVLDVGCGAGGVGRSLRSRADELVGIEIDERAAAEAEQVYDTVVVGTVEDVLPGLAGPFDAVLCYDVLEHLVDPERVLGELRACAAPDALLHVSVPNARHWTLVRDLVLRGTFGYTDWGHRDRTHLRWLTSADLVRLLEGGGWRVERVAHAPLSPAGALAERLTRGRSAEFLVYQWSALARAT
ncbi:MAG TPA: class I SAM-dependent methyltransferase [Gaiellaceae bacterium]|nr:class I SAM-dependent methyltransferase [Gaiellaceae bacterium]